MRTLYHYGLSDGRRLTRCLIPIEAVDRDARRMIPIKRLGFCLIISRLSHQRTSSASCSCPSPLIPSVADSMRSVYSANTRDGARSGRIRHPASSCIRQSVSALDRRPMGARVLQRRDPLLSRPPRSNIRASSGRRVTRSEVHATRATAAWPSFTLGLHLCGGIRSRRTLCWFTRLHTSSRYPTT